MTKKMQLVERNEFAFELTSLDGKEDKIKGRVEQTRYGLDLFFDGYGTCEMEDGHGPPIHIRVMNGHPEILVWGDVNNPDVTQSISLKKADESRRKVEDGQT